MQPYRYCPLCASPLTPREIEGVARLACSRAACRFVHWDGPQPVVAVIVRYGAGVVLARNAQWPRRLFSVISGYVERAEHPADTAVREVREELGLHSTLERFVGCYPFAEKNQLILAFAVRATGDIVTNAELAETKIVTLDALRQYDFRPLTLTAALVRDWLAGQRGIAISQP